MYYFGFPTCPWCVELLPVLDKELQADHGKAYTVDVRGKHYSDADNAIVKKILSNLYQRRQIIRSFCRCN